MVLVQHRRAVATYPTRDRAEQAFKHLYCAGFPIARISVVSKESELLDQLEAAIRNKQLEDKTPPGKAPCAMITGSIVGALGGCLTSIGILSIPGVAPALAIGGAVGAALASTLAGAGIGLASGGVISTCNGLGVASDREIEGDRLSPEEYLLVINGTDEDVCRAEKLLTIKCQ